MKISEKAKQWLDRLKSKKNRNIEFNQVIEVATIMLKNDKSFETAVYEVVQKYGVTESTIRDACTRRLKLTTRDFISRAKYPEDLVDFLKKKFPDKEQEIESLLK